MVSHITNSPVIEKDQDYVLGVYPRAPFVLKNGSGMTVYDTEGKGYLDFGSGIAVNALGHTHPEIVAAVQDQVAQLSHVCNLYHSAPQAELAEMLHVSLRHIRRMDAVGKLPKPVRLGNSVRWRTEEINDWLNAGAPNRQDWEAMQGVQE